MKKTTIILKNISHENIKGWIVSISDIYDHVNEQPIKISDVFQSKNLAWRSIDSKASKLKFENDKITFNDKDVTSYEDVLKEVDLIEEKIEIPMNKNRFIQIKKTNYKK
jgi:hypothetical protein